MKLCIIGSSHAACLKAAFDENPEALAGHNVDFYAAPAARLDMKIEGGRLRPRSPGRLFSTIENPEAGLEIGAYDALVLSGCGWHKPLPGESDPLRHPEQSVAAHIRGQGSARTAMALAESFRGPLILQPRPAPSRKVAADPTWFLNRVHGGGAAGAWARFFRAQYVAFLDIAEHIGAVVLPYPLPGPLKDGFMADGYCRGDKWHGNARYGALVLRQIAAANEGT